MAAHSFLSDFQRCPARGCFVSKQSPSNRADGKQPTFPVEEQRPRPKPERAQHKLGSSRISGERRRNFVIGSARQPRTSRFLGGRLPPFHSLYSPYTHRILTVVPLRTLQRYYGEDTVRIGRGEPEDRVWKRRGDGRRQEAPRGPAGVRLKNHPCLKMGQGAPCRSGDIPCGEAKSRPGHSRVSGICTRTEDSNDQGDWAFPGIP